MRVTDRNDWFDIWCEDKESILATMIRNMSDDLSVGYNYFGNCIKRQRQMIDDYKSQMDAEFDSFKSMDEKEVNRWCFYDLKKRGAIG